MHIDTQRSRTGDGIHHALDHHGLEEILAAPDLLRHVRDHRVLVGIDLFVYIINIYVCVCVC